MLVVSLIVGGNPTHRLSLLLSPFNHQINIRTPSAKCVYAAMDQNSTIYGYNSMLIFFHHLQKLKDVQEFLRLPYRDMHSRQVKIHTAPLLKQIENWDDVYKTLRGTSYQNFLFSD